MIISNMESYKLPENSVYIATPESPKGVMPEVYLDDVRELYRDSEASYQGRRTPEQEEIAAEFSVEADKYFQDRVEFFLALTSPSEEKWLEESIRAEEGEWSVGEVTLNDMKESWRQLWVGMGILTNRLSQSSPYYQSKYNFELKDVPHEERNLIMHELFNQFVEHNALRFGTDAVEGIDTVERKWRLDDKEQFVGELVRRNRDLAQNDQEVIDRIEKLGYTEGIEDHSAMHAAGKMSPEEARQLRREYSELDTIRFFKMIGYNRNSRSVLEAKEDE